jgi:hypothetical protein
VGVLAVLVWLLKPLVIIVVICRENKRKGKVCCRENSVRSSVQCVLVCVHLPP